MVGLESEVLEATELKPNESEVSSARQWREWSAVGGYESATADPTAKMSDAEVSALVSAEAHELVYDTEVSGRSGYAKYRRPEWPGGESGITIGIGFDLGYQTASDFEKAYKGIIDSATFDRLTPYIGFNTGETHSDRAARMERARRIVEQLRDVDISWEQADAAYRRFNVPDVARKTLRALPNSSELHPDSFGALFSLIYNRGAGMAAGDKRREMRNIRDDMRDRHFDLVPSEIRAMKRLWVGSFSGLVKRRELEARLFERGLSKKSVLVASAMPTESGLESASGSNRPLNIDRDLQGWFEELNEPDFKTSQHEASQPWDSVAWPKSDDESPEYRHVRNRQLSGKTFQLAAADIELLLRANRFEPSRGNDRIVFGLRGAVMVKSLTDTTQEFAQTEREALTLVDARPDHRTFRCTIGVYNLKTRRLSGFVASTVPNARAVHAYRVGDIPGCNMLPSGCYTFTVGRHNPNSSNVPGCLIENGAPRCVIRSRNDDRYDVKDAFDPNPPGDNIHPAFYDRSAQFSSLGCQTIRGTWTGDEITAEYAMFRTAMGFAAPGAKADNGKLFDYVLLTGLEAAIAADLRRRGLDQDTAAVDAELGALRQGSKGDLVRKLQAALGVQVTGDFSPKLKRTLSDVQKSKLNWADGVYCPEMDAKLNLHIFSPDPTAPMVMASAGGPKLETAGAARKAGAADQLFYEIGARSRMARADLETFNSAPVPDPDLHEAFLGMNFSDVVDVGKRVFTRIEKSAHNLICGDSPEDQADRAKIIDALNGSAAMAEGSRDEKMIQTLTWMLTAYFMIPMPINRLAAELLYQRVFKPMVVDSGKAVVDGCCQMWTRRLRSAPEIGATA